MQSIKFNEDDEGMLFLPDTKMRLTLEKHTVNAKLTPQAKPQAF
jgi:hypothetical protein